MRFLARWLISAISIYIISLLPIGLSLKSFKTAIVAAAILAIVDTVIKPILIILTLPINIMTLGLFTFIVNGIVLRITSAIVIGFKISNIFAAVVAAILIGMVNVSITSATGIEKNKKNRYRIN